MSKWPTEQELIDGGTPRWLAEMVAARRAPGVQGGETTFMTGRRNGEDFDNMVPECREQLLENCRKAGVSVQGKLYMSQLADYPGDPKAVVSDESEVQAICKKRGFKMKKD